MVDLTDCMYKLGLSVHDENAVMGAGDGNVPPETITDPSHSPFTPKSALQIVVIKSNKKLTLKDVGIDPDSIKVQCYQTVTDEEKEEKKSIKKYVLNFSSITNLSSLSSQCCQQYCALWSRTKSSST